MDKSNITKNLTAREQEVLKSVSIPKLIWATIKIRHKLCAECLPKVNKNPKACWDLCCVKCKSMANDMLRGLLPK